MEGMPVATLASRKKSLVQELNGFIAQKKTLTEQAESIKELTQSSKKGEVSTRGRAGRAPPLSKYGNAPPSDHLHPGAQPCGFCE